VIVYDYRSIRTLSRARVYDPTIPPSRLHCFDRVARRFFARKSSTPIRRIRAFRITAPLSFNIGAPRPGRTSREGGDAKTRAHRDSRRRVCTPSPGTRRLLSACHGRRRHLAHRALPGGRSPRRQRRRDQKLTRASVVSRARLPGQPPARLRADDSVSQRAHASSRGPERLAVVVGTALGCRGGRAGAPAGPAGCRALLRAPHMRSSAGWAPAAPPSPSQGLRLGARPWASARAPAPSEADMVVAGGYDGLCRFVLRGFNGLRSLTRDKIRPFDRRRSDCCLGEAAGLVLLCRRA